jgi:hypothetical protein
MASKLRPALEHDKGYAQIGTNHLPLVKIVLLAPKNSQRGQFAAAIKYRLFFAEITVF